MICMIWLIRGDGSRIKCMIDHVFPVFDLYYPDPAHFKNGGISGRLIRPHLHLRYSLRVRYPIIPIYNQVKRANNYALVPGSYR